MHGERELEGRDVAPDMPEPQHPGSEWRANERAQSPTRDGPGNAVCGEVRQALKADDGGSRLRAVLAVNGAGEGAARAERNLQRRDVG